MTTNTDAKADAVLADFQAFTKRVREIAVALDDLERNVLLAVERGPIMESDIGPADRQVNALVDKGLLQWLPEGCVYTELGRAIAAVFANGGA